MLLTLRLTAMRQLKLNLKLTLYTHDDKPWITHTIRKSVKTKYRLYNQFDRERDQLKKDLYVL